jgi:hypothetical protein
MSSTPYRRSAQATGAAPPSFVESLSRLRSSSSFLVQLLSTSTSSSSEVLTELKTLSSRLSAFETSSNKASVHDKAKAAGWEVEVDAAGTLLWNKSTALRHRTVDEGAVEVSKEVQVVAERASFFFLAFFSFSC